MAWKAPPGRFSAVSQPTRHDHVGRMQFTDDTATCLGCGQTWRMTYRPGPDGPVPGGWQPQPVTGRQLTDL